MMYSEKMFLVRLEKTEFSPVRSQMPASYKKACMASYLEKGVLFLRKMRMDLLSHSHTLDNHVLYVVAI